MDFDYVEVPMQKTSHFSARIKALRASKSPEQKTQGLFDIKLGFKAGLEIHQQLDTPKLFSGAPSYLRNDEPHYILKRKLHVVAGETGEIDPAVLHEAALGKEFFYEGYIDTVSLVELDEEPPREINEEALNVALQVALLLNCEIYTTTQVMRKTVIDGSNTSGFQRTVLIAHDGFVETSFGKIKVESVCLEEDSARLILREKNKVVFRLDRLGVPLVEIATAPDMKNAEQVKECALKLGEILRACRVKRGIGTIRQDVNVSVKGHNRVEIKGFQEPRMMIETINKEIERQLQELKNGKKEGEVRNAMPDGKTEFLRPMPGKSRMYPETDLELLKIPLERINKLKKNLPKLRADMKSELKRKGLSDELIGLILDSPENLDEFETLMKVYDRSADLVAKMVSLWRNEFASKMKKSLEEIKEILTERALEKILELVIDCKLDSKYVKEVMRKIIEGEKFEDAVKVDKISDDEIEKFVMEIVKEKPGLGENAYMGLVMQKFKGKVDAEKAMETIKKVLDR